MTSPLGGIPRNDEDRFWSLEACESKTITLALWKKSDPSKRQIIPWECCGWRHLGPCARYASQRDYSRLMTALRPVNLRTICFAVLTLDKRGRAAGVRRSYAALWQRWRPLYWQLRRQFGAFDYYAAVEQHRDGFPHLNLVLVIPQLAAWCDAPHLAERCLKRQWNEQRSRFEHGCVSRAQRWLKDTAPHYGFGYRASIHRAVSKDYLAGYVTKIEYRQSAIDPVLGAEITKRTQAPIAAPKRFRRTRSSRGFLPPLPHDDSITGEMLRDGKPMRKKQSPAEIDKLREELEQLARERGVRRPSGRELSRRASGVVVPTQGYNPFLGSAVRYDHLTGEIFD